MNATTEVFVLFLIMVAGVLSRRLGYLTDDAIHGVTRMVLNIALPCLTIYNMQREFSYEVFIGFLLSLFGASVLILLCLAVGWMLFRSRKHPRRLVLSHAMAFPNCGFMGYPIILAINPDWMIYAVAYNIAYNLIFWSVGVGMYGSGLMDGLRKTLRNPNFIASILGFVLFCLRFRWPEPISQTLSLLGGLTTPLTMILIGTRLVGIHVKELFLDRDYPIAVVLRLLIIPVAARLFFAPLPAPVGVRESLFLLTAMPIASLVTMQAEVAGGDTVFAARFSALSTLLSLVTIPVMALLL